MHIGIRGIIREYSDIFHLPGEKLTTTHVAEHTIPLYDESLIVNERPYRFPPAYKEEIDRQVKELLEGGIIVPSESPYNSPVWMVAKKADNQGKKKFRMVLDYRKLNKNTIPFTYPIPNPVEIFDGLKGSVWFSILDAASGFLQLNIKESDRMKTAFSTPYGKFEFVTMPFGLCSAPSSFQRMMDNALIGLQGVILFSYIDDIIVFSKTFEEHVDENTIRKTSSL